MSFSRLHETPLAATPHAERPHQQGDATRNHRVACFGFAELRSLKTSVAILSLLLLDLGTFVAITGFITGEDMDNGP